MPEEEKIVETSRMLRRETIHLTFPSMMRRDYYGLQLKRTQRVNLQTKEPELYIQYSVIINGKEIDEDEFRIISSVFPKKEKIFASRNEPIEL